MRMTVSVLKTMPSTLHQRSAAKMNILTLAFFAGVFLTEAVLTVALKDFRRFIILHSFRKPENSTRLMGIRNGLRCCFECEKMPTCIAVNFHTGDKVCDLLESGTTPLYPKSTTGWTFYYSDSKYLYHFFNAIASQKSTYTSGRSGVIGAADLGIDGNTDPNFYHGSCFHSDRYTEFPWWMVDLFVNFRVESVIMWNRLDYGCGRPCWEHLTDLTITVSTTQSEIDDPSNVCATYLGPPSSSNENPVVVNCSRVMVGRYIKIYMNKQEAGYLLLCEVDFA